MCIRDSSSFCCIIGFLDDDTVKACSSTIPGMFSRSVTETGSRPSARYRRLRYWCCVSFFALRRYGDGSSSRSATCRLLAWRYGSSRICWCGPDPLSHPTWCSCGSSLSCNSWPFGFLCGSFCSVSSGSKILPDATSGSGWSRRNVCWPLRILSLIHISEPTRPY